MKERKYYIYYHKSKDGKYYIGQTCQDIDDRWKKGAGYNSKKFNRLIIEEHGGWDSFEHGILEDNISSEDVDEREAYYIKFYDSVDNGFNTYKQNYNGYHFSELWADENIRKDIIDKLTKMRNTEEYHNQQSNRMKEIWKSEEYRASQQKKWTEERKKQASERSKALWRDAKYKENLSKKISENQKNKWKDKEYRKKQCKAVRCIETEEIFESIKAAAEWCGVKPNTLCAALSSKTHQSGKHPESGIKLHWERYTYEV